MTWPIDPEGDFNPGLPGMAACEICGVTELEVAYVSDPYDRDINDTIVMRWLCIDCWGQRADDI